MQDRQLLQELLNADSEGEALDALEKRHLMDASERWRFLGDMANNQSIVLAQQSTAAAALVEKFTNSIDAVLLKHCKAEGVDPRAPEAPQSMSKAVERYFGDLGRLESGGIRRLAEENVVLFATGSKSRPSLSIYDAGEGQFASNFPATFCSLISGSTDGSYKGAIPFVQGRFNMGGTGVLPFCGERRKMQLIVSRVPSSIAGGEGHEWAFTVLCFFPSKQSPSWKYLVGLDNEVLTAGTEQLRMLPEKNVGSGQVPKPRVREVDSGTLVKMYDFKAARSNICGEQFKKLQDYLIQPALPLRVVECRETYKAKVMAVTIWDRLDAWGSDKLESGFEEGAAISIELSTGEVVPAEVRVFRSSGAKDESLAHTGLRALINGQSHAKRDANFFKTKAVDKEHIAGSMLVTLDCTELGQDSRNAIFMSNRETFREDPLLQELFRKLQKELKAHEGLSALNLQRYEEKIKSAVTDDEGLTALEELLTTDPALAELFGGVIAGKVSAKTAGGGGEKVLPEAVKFVGKDFPTFVHRRDGSASVSFDVHHGSIARVSFLTDMKNNYFSRRKLRGSCTFEGDFTATHHPFNGRLTFTTDAALKAPVGSVLSARATITDKTGTGPFELDFKLTVLPEREEREDKEKKPRPPTPPKDKEGPSRPNIKEADNGPNAPALTIEKEPNSDRLQLILNTTSQALQDAKTSRPEEEGAAVAFVFKYGLALVAMGLIEAKKKTDQWNKDQAACRKEIEDATEGVARVIVPICLSLPKNIPKKT